MILVHMQVIRTYERDTRIVQIGTMRIDSPVFKLTLLSVSKGSDATTVQVAKQVHAGIERLDFPMF